MDEPTITFPAIKVKRRLQGKSNAGLLDKSNRNNTLAVDNVLASIPYSQRSSVESGAGWNRKFTNGEQQRLANIAE